MLFTLLWFGVFFLGGVAKYSERQGWKTCQNVAGLHEQLNFPLYMFVSQACVLCSEQVGVNNLLGKTMVSQPLTPPPQEEFKRESLTCICLNCSLLQSYCKLYFEGVMQVKTMFAMQYSHYFTCHIFPVL